MSNAVDYDKTVQDGELQKWGEPGTVVEGVLYSYSSRDTSKGKGNLYEVKTATGLVPFFAPSLLHKKLREVSLNNLVRIEYIKETKTMTGNPLKHFEVQWTKATPDKLKALGIDLYDNDVETEVSVDDIEV